MLYMLFVIIIIISLASNDFSKKRTFPVGKISQAPSIECLKTNNILTLGLKKEVVLLKKIIKNLQPVSFHFLL